MNANTSHILKRTMLSLAFGICLTFVATAEVLAHDVGYGRGYVAAHYVYGDAGQFPGWLRRDRDFQHWYWHSRYCFNRHPHWHRLYHLYLIDRHQQRHARSRHDYYLHDHDYRAYKKRR